MESEKIEDNANKMDDNTNSDVKVTISTVLTTATTTIVTSIPSRPSTRFSSQRADNTQTTATTTRATRMSQNPDFAAKQRKFLNRVSDAMNNPDDNNDEILSSGSSSSSSLVKDSAFANDNKTNIINTTDDTSNNSTSNNNNNKLSTRVSRACVISAEKRRRSESVTRKSVSETKTDSEEHSSAESNEMASTTSDTLPVKKNKKVKLDTTVCSKSQLVSDGSDPYCWRCHRDGVLMVFCKTCPRSYHTRCTQLETVPQSDWVCPECTAIVYAENTDTRSSAMKSLSLDQLCNLLKYTVLRMKGYAGSEWFCKAVDQTEFPEYKNYVVRPMDLALLEKHIKQKRYGSTEAFLADAKWILHNCVVFNTFQSKLTNIAKALVKICRQEMAEIENCPDCYLNAHTRKDSWFIEVCRRPHLLVWAKLKGFPFWPAKAMRTNNENHVDVRFFGAHDRAWVPVSNVYLYSLNYPTPGKNKKKNNLDECILEVELHIKKLRDRFGLFEYSSFKVLFSPEKEEQQLQSMLPGYVSATQSNTRRLNRTLISYKSVDDHGHNVQGKKEESETKRKSEANLSKTNKNLDNSKVTDTINSEARLSNVNREILQQNDRKSESNSSTMMVSRSSIKRRSSSIASDNSSVSDNIKITSCKEGAGDITDSLLIDKDKNDKELSINNALKEEGKGDNSGVSAVKIRRKTIDNSITNVVNKDNNGNGNNSDNCNKILQEIDKIDENIINKNIEEKTQEELKKDFINNLELRVRNISEDIEDNVSDNRNNRINDNKNEKQNISSTFNKLSKLIENDTISNEDKLIKNTSRNLLVVNSDCGEGDNSKLVTTDDSNTESSNDTKSNDLSDEHSKSDNKVVDIEDTVTSEKNNEGLCEGKTTASNIVIPKTVTDENNMNINKKQAMIVLSDIIKTSNVTVNDGANIIKQNDQQIKFNIDLNKGNDVIKRENLSDDEWNDENVNFDDVTEIKRVSSICSTENKSVKCVSDQNNDIHAMPLLLPASSSPFSTSSSSDTEKLNSKKSITNRFKSVIKGNNKTGSKSSSSLIMLDSTLDENPLVIIDNENSDMKTKQNFISSSSSSPSSSAPSSDTEKDESIRNEILKSVLKCNAASKSSIISKISIPVISTVVDKCNLLNKRKSKPVKIRSRSNTSSSDDTAVEELKRICEEQESIQNLTTIASCNDNHSTSSIDEVLDEVSGRFRRKNAKENPNITITLISSDSEESTNCKKLVKEIRPSVSLSKDVSLTLVDTNNKDKCYNDTSKDLATSLEMECVESDPEEQPVAVNQTRLKPTARKTITKPVSTPAVNQVKSNNEKICISNSNSKSSSVMKQVPSSSTNKLSVKKVTPNLNPINDELRHNNAVSLKLNSSDSSNVKTASNQQPLLSSPSSIVTKNTMVTIPVPPVAVSSQSNNNSCSSSSSSSSSSPFAMNRSNTTQARVLPQLQPKPPPTIAASNNDSIGPASLQLDNCSQKMTQRFRSMLEEILRDLSTEGSTEATVKSLQIEMERLQWKHRQELSELKHNTDLILMEMKASLEAEKQRAVTETRMKCEAEKEAAVNETKMRQWCALCKKEALFYCCWNTAYCNYPCQQAHWPQHMSVCAQAARANVSAETNMTKASVGPSKNLTPAGLSSSGVPNATKSLASCTGAANSSQQSGPGVMTSQSHSIHPSSDITLMPPPPTTQPVHHHTNVGSTTISPIGYNRVLATKPPSPLSPPSPAVPASFKGHLSVSVRPPQYFMSQQRNPQTSGYYR